MLRTYGKSILNRMTVIFLILVLTTSGLSPTPVSAAHGFAPDTGQSAPGQNDPAHPQQSKSGQPDVPTDQIILKYNPATSAFVVPARTDQMSRLSAAAGISFRYLRVMSGDAVVIGLPEALPLAQVQAISLKLMSLPEVEYAEPDQRLFPTLIPNDTYYLNQWDLYESNGIHALAAWDVTTGSSSLVVADIDTGITNHADLSGRSVPGYDFISDSRIGNDANGREADPSDPGDWITPAESSSGFLPAAGSETAPGTARIPPGRSGRAVITAWA